MSPLAILLAVASLSFVSAFSWPHWGPAQDRTLPGVELDSEADWNGALTKNVSRQTLYNNIIKEVFNSMTRIIGWALIALVLYGNLLSDSKRKKRSLEVDHIDHSKEEEIVDALRRSLRKGQMDGWQ